MSRLCWLVVGVCWSVVGSAGAQRSDTLSVTTAQNAVDSGYAWPAPGHDHFLSLEATGLYDSNALRNDLVLGLWKGEVLDRETRQRSEGHVDRVNRAGYVLEARLAYAWGDSLFGNGHMRPRLSVGYHDVMGLRYANDLYHTTFFGNADFENATAELGPTRFEQVRYQSFGFGFEDIKTRSYLVLQVVNGQSLNAADIDRADLFTATDGRYLRLELDGSYASSDTSRGTGFRTNGIGAAISGEVRAPFRLCGRTGVVVITVQDLGAIAWNGSSLRVPKDTLILYEGIRVDDVLDLDGVFTGRGALQDTLGFGYQPGAFLRPLPAALSLKCGLNAVYNMIYEARVDVRNLPGYRLHASLSAGHFFGGRNVLRAEVSFGGFGGWRAGASAQRMIAKGLRVRLATTNALGLVSRSARGKSVMFGLEYDW